MAYPRIQASTARIVNKSNHRKQDKDTGRRAGGRQGGMAAFSVTLQRCETFTLMASGREEYKTPEEGWLKAEL